MNLWMPWIAVMPRASFLFIPINRFIRIQASTFAIGRARDPIGKMVESSFRRAQTSRWVRHAGQLALILTFFALIFAVAWAARASILRGVADLWVVSDDTDKADAIVVLGGGVGARPFVAADLYKRGLAQQILIANVRPDPVAELKIVPPETDLTRQVLIRLGVPPAAIIEFGAGVSSTYEEARAILDSAKNSA